MDVCEGVVRVTQECGKIKATFRYTECGPLARELSGQLCRWWTGDAQGGQEAEAHMCQFVNKMGQHAGEALKKTGFSFEE